MEKEVKNARIESTHLGFEDHRILTGMLHLDFGGTHQGFGGWFLDNWSEEEKRRVPDPACGLFVKRVIETVGVSTWEELKGKHVRAVRDERGYLVAIGHIVKENWFFPGEEIKALLAVG